MSVELLPSPSTEPARVRTAYRNQATQRVLSVLSAFIGHGVRGVTEIARALAMNKNMAHRALTVLTREGYLSRDASGERYQLGHRVLALNSCEADEFDIATLCRPYLHALHAVTGESVFLSIIVGGSRVNIDWIEARGRRVNNGQRGRSVPLHCTRMSRALLACLDDEEIADYLRAAAPLDRYDAIFPATANESAEDVWEDVRRLRRDGYLVWRNPQQQYGAGYIAFPVLDSVDRPHALVTVGGPFERFGPDRINELLPELRELLDPLQQQGRLFPAPPVLMAAPPAFSAAPPPFSAAAL
jgi:DNA-binding IclR family transcriptional regulator